MVDLLGVVVLAPEPILSAVGVFVGHCRYLWEGTGAVSRSSVVLKSPPWTLDTVCLLLAMEDIDW